MSPRTFFLSTNLQKLHSLPQLQSLVRSNQLQVRRWKSSKEKKDKKGKKDDKEFKGKKDCGPCAKKPKMDLECKVALVTGGDNAVSVATADQLLCSNLYRVVLAGMDPCAGQAAALKLNEAHGKNKCCFMPLNVRCPKQFEHVASQIINKFGNLDILVNNATLLDEKNWEMEIDVNYRALVQSNFIVKKMMKEQKNKGGVIINMTDLKGFTGDVKEPVYASSKGAVNIFTISTEEEKGVRTVALSQGVTATEGKSKQKPISVARAILFIAQYSEGGCIWIVRDCQLFKANWPDHTSFSEKVSSV